MPAKKAAKRPAAKNSGRRGNASKAGSSPRRPRTTEFQTALKAGHLPKARNAFVLFKLSRMDMLRADGTAAWNKQCALIWKGMPESEKPHWETEAALERQAQRSALDQLGIAARPSQARTNLPLAPAIGEQSVPDNVDDVPAQASDACHLTALSARAIGLRSEAGGHWLAPGGRRRLRFGHFMLFERVGAKLAGAFSTILEAVDRRTFMRVALMVYTDCEDARRTLRKEVDLLQALSAPGSPHILPILASEPDAIITYFAIPWAGVTANVVASEGSDVDVLAVVRQVTAALAYLGQLNVVHADIKPRNVMFQPIDAKVAVVDFNIAEDISKAFVPKHMYTSPQYRAPELFVNEVGRIPRCLITPAIDAWSFGCLVFYMVVNRHLFLSTSESQLKAEVLRFADYQKARTDALRRGMEDSKRSETFLREVFGIERNVLYNGGESGDSNDGLGDSAGSIGTMMLLAAKWIERYTAPRAEDRRKF